MKIVTIISRKTILFVFNCTVCGFFFLTTVSNNAIAEVLHTTISTYENGGVLEKRMALQKLLQYREETLFPLFENAATHKDQYIRKYAYEGISQYSFISTRTLLQKALRDTSKLVLKSSIPLFLSMPSESVADLLFLLKHKDPEIVVETLKVLGYLGDKHTFFPIENALRSSHLSVRLQALKSLKVLISRIGFDIKNNLDGDFEVEKRVAAVDALDHISTPLIAHLKKSLSKENVQEKIWALLTVRAVADIFLEKLEAYLWFEEDEKLLEKSKGIQSNFLGLVPLLTSKFYYEPENLKWYILSFLTLLKQEESVSVFKDALEKGPLQIRAEAVNGLIRIGNKESLSAIVIFLNDPNPFIKIKVIEAIYEMGDQGYATRLFPLLNDLHPTVQWKAATTLGILSNRKAVDPLIALLQSKNPSLRKAAVKSLGQIGDNKALEPLIEMHDDSDYLVRAEVVRALGLLGNGSLASNIIFDLLSDENKYVRRASLQSFRQLLNGASFSIMEESVVDRMISLLDDSDFFVRGYSLKVLGRYKNSKILPAINLLLKEEKNSIVREEAEMTLLKIYSKK